MVQVEDIVTLVKSADIDVDPSSLQADVPLVLQGFDSLDIATLMFQVEREYGSTISAEESFGLRCLSDFVNMLNRSDSSLK
jgi:acyl carrier protein